MVVANANFFQLSEPMHGFIVKAPYHAASWVRHEQKQSFTFSRRLKCKASHLFRSERYKAFSGPV